MSAAFADHLTISNPLVSGWKLKRSLLILARCTDDWILVGSEVIKYEIAAIADNERMKNVKNLLKISKERIVINEDISERAREYQSSGIDTFDSIHIACAEYAKAIFLTTDDVLIKVIIEAPG